MTENVEKCSTVRPAMRNNVWITNQQQVNMASILDHKWQWKPEWDLSDWDILCCHSGANGHKCWCKEVTCSVKRYSVLFYIALTATLLKIQWWVQEPLHWKKITKDTFCVMSTFIALPLSTKRKLSALLSWCSRKNVKSADGNEDSYIFKQITNDLFRKIFILHAEQQLIMSWNPNWTLRWNHAQLMFSIIQSVALDDVPIFSKRNWREKKQVNKALSLMNYIYIFYWSYNEVWHCGISIANMICNMSILGSNPMADCKKSLSGIKCCSVQKAMANYRT